MVMEQPKNSPVGKPVKEISENREKKELEGMVQNLDGLKAYVEKTVQGAGDRFPMLNISNYLAIVRASQELYTQFQADERGFEVYDYFGKKILPELKKQAKEWRMQFKKDSEKYLIPDTTKIGVDEPIYGSATLGDYMALLNETQDKGRKFLEFVKVVGGLPEETFKPGTKEYQRYAQLNGAFCRDLQARKYINAALRLPDQELKALTPSEIKAMWLLLKPEKGKLGRFIERLAVIDDMNNEGQGSFERTVQKFPELIIHAIGIESIESSLNESVASETLHLMSGSFYATEQLKKNTRKNKIHRLVMGEQRAIREAKKRQEARQKKLAERQKAEAERRAHEQREILAIEKDLGLAKPSPLSSVAVEELNKIDAMTDEDRRAYRASAYNKLSSIEKEELAQIATDIQRVDVENMTIAKIAEQLANDFKDTFIEIYSTEQGFLTPVKAKDVKVFLSVYEKNGQLGLGLVKEITPKERKKIFKELTKILTDDKNLFDLNYQLVNQFIHKEAESFFQSSLVIDIPLLNSGFYIYINERLKSQKEFLPKKDFEFLQEIIRDQLLTQACLRAENLYPHCAVSDKNPRGQYANCVRDLHFLPIKRKILGEIQSSDIEALNTGPSGSGWLDLVGFAEKMGQVDEDEIFRDNDAIVRMRRLRNAIKDNWGNHRIHEALDIVPEGQVNYSEGATDFDEVDLETLKNIWLLIEENDYYVAHFIKKLGEQNPDSLKMLFSVNANLLLQNYHHLEGVKAVLVREFGKKQAKNIWAPIQEQLVFLGIDKLPRKK